MAFSAYKPSEIKEKGIKGTHEQRSTCLAPPRLAFQPFAEQAIQLHTKNIVVVVVVVGSPRGWSLTWLKTNRDITWSIGLDGSYLQARDYWLSTLSSSCWCHCRYCPQPLGTEVNKTKNKHEKNLVSNNDQEEHSSIKVTESLLLFLSLTETFCPSKELKIPNEKSDCQYLSLNIALMQYYNFLFILQPRRVH